MTALITGSANEPLARAIAGHLDIDLTPSERLRFPDGEAGVSVDPAVRAHDVFVVQSLVPPVDPSLIELALLADACKRADCARLTVVMPYVGYARQDRRTQDGQAVGARVVTELLQAVGVDRMLVVDPHTAQLEAMVSIPLDSVSAVGILAEDLSADLAADAVVVAPDLGAAKRADRFAERLGLPTALVSKTRLDGRRVEVDHVVGDVRGRVPLIVDDMISTGGTIAAAVEAVRGVGCAEPFRVAATHGLFVEDAEDVLAGLMPESVVVTDTLPRDADAPFPLHTRSIAPLLAGAIERLSTDRPLGDLAAHG